MTICANGLAVYHTYRQGSNILFLKTHIIYHIQHINCSIFDRMGRT